MGREVVYEACIVTICGSGDGVCSLYCINVGQEMVHVACTVSICGSGDGACSLCCINMWVSGWCV